MTIVVCDTSTLVKLSKGDALGVLGDLFDKVYLPRGVDEECQDAKLSEGLRQPFFEIYAVENILSIGMGKGEREAISLALERNIKTIITDDIKAYRKAKTLGLEPLTFRKVLLLAKKANLIEAVKPVLDKMKLRGEGIKDEVYDELLRLAGEL
jgi:predicted nucleic acid-binding protein